MWKIWSGKWRAWKKGNTKIQKWKISSVKLRYVDVVKSLLRWVEKYFLMYPALCSPTSRSQSPQPPPLPTTCSIHGVPIAMCGNKLLCLRNELQQLLPIFNTRIDDAIQKKSQLLITTTYRGFSVPCYKQLNQHTN